MTDQEAIEFMEKLVDRFENEDPWGILMYSSDECYEACKRILELAKHNPRDICDTCKLRRESEGEL